MSETPKDVDAAISARTRLALSEAKARGVQLGKAGADNIRATVEKRKSAADAFAKQHEALFADLPWTHGQVQRILNRYADWAAESGAK